MSYKATHWAWDLELRMPEKFVLVALADMADESFSCFPGQKRLAEMTGASVRTVGRALDRLEEMKLIRREQRRAADGYRTSDRYVLNVGVALPDDYTSESQVTESHMTDSPISPDTQSDLTRQRVVAIEQPDESLDESPEGATVFELDVPKGTRSALAISSPFKISAADRVWASEHVPSVNVDVVTRDFVAYWREGEGKGKRKKNWPLTWRTWLRREHARNVERGWKPDVVGDERKVIRGGRVVVG